MKIISLINQKGGTAKTTTAVNLGSALSMLGKTVLLIDLDPQANLTYSFGVRPEKGSVAEFLQTKQALPTIIVNMENLSILPSSPALADLEISLTTKIGREQVLKDCLSKVKGYDYVLIDCPPSLSILTVNALNASHEVLIPLQVEVLSLQGLNLLLDTIGEVKAVLNKDLKIRGIVPSMYDSRRKLSREILEELGRNTKEKVFSTVIRECVKLAEAPSFAKSIFSYSPASNGATDFMNLAKEFLEERS